jgi:hypothetical protein
MLDRLFLFCSIVVVLISHFSSGNNEHLISQTKYILITLWNFYYIHYNSLFIAGEMDRHNKISFIKVTGNYFNNIKYSIFGSGIILFGLWIHLFKERIIGNLMNLFVNLMSLMWTAILIPISIAIVIKQKTKDKRNAII